MTSYKLNLPIIQIQNCQIGVISSNIVGLLSVTSEESNDFGFIVFTDSGPKGEIIIPLSLPKVQFDIQEYILSSLQKDLVYEQQGEIKHLLQDFFDFVPYLLKGNISRNLFLNEKIIWEYEYEEELVLKMASDVLPSDSRFACRDFSKLKE